MDIIVISSDEEDEDESKLVSHCEHKCDNYKSAPTRKKQKRFCKKKKRKVPDDDSTSCSDSELHSPSTMKWTTAISMKSDMSYHSLIPKQNERVSKIFESIPRQHLSQPRHRQSFQKFKHTRDKRNKISYRTFQKSQREPCHHPDSNNGQCHVQRHEKHANGESARQVGNFLKEKVNQADTSCHQSPIETILISSGVSDSDSDCSKDTFRSVSGLKVSLPLSPQSDYEEFTDHELGKILEDARAVNKSVDNLDEIVRYSPVSPPSSVKSPMEICVIERQDTSSTEVFHPSTKSTRENVCPKEERVDLTGNADDFQNFACDREQPSKSSEEMSPVSNPMDQDTSDFEEVLSKSTFIALSQTIVSSSDDPDESDDELPVIDYFSAEISEILSGNVDVEGPPLLGRYGQSPTPNDVQESQKQMLRLSDTDEDSSASVRADCDDAETIGSKSGITMEVHNSRYKTPINMKVLPPNHIWEKGKRNVEGEDTVPSVPFTSHMVNLVEACYDEEFVSASISLMQSFTTTRLAPPADMIHFLLKSVLLDVSMSSRDALEAYKVLRHVQTLHPFSERMFHIEWEFLQNVWKSLVDAMTSFSVSNEWTSKERGMLALKFMVSVFESDVFHEGSSVDPCKTPVLERYMVRDVLEWLDVCITTFNAWSSYVHQQFVKELTTQLQKLLHFCCLQRFGDHRDFIARNLVHSLRHLDLPQKRHFLETITCHKLRQQLLELYLESNFEIPCCTLCESNDTKVASTRQLSLQKWCNYHVHKRPLEVTQNIRDDDVMYYADEETGERVIIKPVQEAGPVRRHCTSCSRRIRLSPEHCEELVLVLFCLLQSLMHCPYSKSSGLNQTVSCHYSRGKALHEDDEAALSKLAEHVNILTEDLLLSCSKLTIRTRLYLKEMSSLQRKL